ncbi:MAG: serine/threonine-protein kinase, partial [Gemmatimonadaceae bacterium]
MDPNYSQEGLNAALDGRYRIERELGVGGMATVYGAQDLRHERDVAIKVLHPDLGAALGAERFLSEIKTTAKLQHPHILPLLDSGNANGLLFYVMPLVAGETLRARLERERQLPIEDALLIAREVADALEYAHKQGVIHRDIKPENILLQGGHALVADFGIALAVQSARGARMTQTGLSLGTPQYMSPEQAMGERNIDARSDVYALGAVLYEMLAGDAPFIGSSVQAIVAKVMNERPTPLHTLRDTVPPSVEAAVFTALAKLPADRFPSAAAFAMALYDRGQIRTSQISYSRPPVFRRPIAGLVAVLCAGIAAFFYWKSSTASAEPSITTRSYLRFPVDEAPIDKLPSYAMFPDGSAIVYVGRSATGTQLWIKKRTELHATPISGTIGAANAFISADGAWIAFVANDKVLKVPASGGPPVSIGKATCTEAVCDISEGGTFLDDGRVVHNLRDGMVISGRGGAVTDTLVTSTMIGGLAAMQPNALPDSRGVLFTACTLYCNRADVWVYDMATRKAHLLILSASHPVYVSTGHLLYRDAKGSFFAV